MSNVGFVGIVSNARRWAILADLRGQESLDRKSARVAENALLWLINRRFEYRRHRFALRSH